MPKNVCSSYVDEKSDLCNNCGGTKAAKKKKECTNKTGTGVLKIVDRSGSEYIKGSVTLKMTACAHTYLTVGMQV